MATLQNRRALWIKIVQICSKLKTFRSFSDFVEWRMHGVRFYTFKFMNLLFRISSTVRMVAFTPPMVGLTL